MKRYQALTTSHGPIDIGEYPDVNTARIWALQEYGGDLQDVIEVPSIVVNTTAPDLGWLLVAAMGLAVLALAENKKRKRRHVRART